MPPTCAPGHSSPVPPLSNLIDRAALQLAQSLYHMPTRTLAGNTDAKVPDIQAGYETMQNYIQLLMVAPI